MKALRYYLTKSHVGAGFNSQAYEGVLCQSASGHRL